MHLGAPGHIPRKLDTGQRWKRQTRQFKKRKGAGRDRTFRFSVLRKGPKEGAKEEGGSKEEEVATSNTTGRADSFAHLSFTDPVSGDLQ